MAHNITVGQAWFSCMRAAIHRLENNATLSLYSEEFYLLEKMKKTPIGDKQLSLKDWNIQVRVSPTTSKDMMHAAQKVEGLTYIEKCPKYSWGVHNQVAGRQLGVDDI